MKPYFIKYLPVEGEIKEGDKARHNGEIVTVIKKEGEGDSWKTDGFPIYGSNLGKVKLFLCSRDFTKGEKVYCLEEEQENRNRGLKEGDGEWVNPWCIAGECKACIKVLGEISPDALSYVKEGDEFDEDQVKECFHDERIGIVIEKNFYDAIVDRYNSIKQPLPEFTSVFKIKCPWGHFH